MPVYYNIPGVGIAKFNDGTTRDQAYRIAGVEAPASEAPQERSPFAAGLEAAKTGLSVGLPYAIRNLNGVQTADEWAANNRSQQELQASAARREKLLPGGPAGLDKGVMTALKENVLYSGPQMGAQVIGGIGGFAAGGPAGSALGVAAVGAPFYVGSNVDRATESGNKALTPQAARRSALMAIPQAALDAGIEMVLPGVGHGFSGNLLTRVGKGVLSGAAIEGTTEALQQGGERYAAGLPLANREALGEYGESATIGGLLGGAFGGVGGGFNKANVSSPTVNLPAHESIEAGKPADLLRLPAPRPAAPGVAPAPEPQTLPTEELRSQYTMANIIPHVQGDGITYGEAARWSNRIAKVIATEDPKVLKRLSTDLAKTGDNGLVERVQGVLEDYASKMEEARQAEEQMTAPPPQPDFGAIQQNNQAQVERAVAARQRDVMAQQQQQAQQQEAEQRQQMAMANRSAMFQAELSSKDPGAALKGFLKWVASGKGEHGPTMMMPEEQQLFQQAMTAIRRKQDMKAALDEQALMQQARQLEEKARQSEIRTNLRQQGSKAPKPQDVRITPPEVRQVQPDRPAAPAAPAKTPGNVLVRPAEGPTPRAVAPVKETVGDKIKKQVAAKRKEKSNASEAGSKPEGDRRQRGRADERVAEDRKDRVVETEKPGSRETASRGNRAGPESTEAVEPTYESVLKHAETYLADDGESGLLKPVEYQRLSVLAEQKTRTPQELEDLVEKIAEARRVKLAESAVEDAATKHRRGKKYDPNLRSKLEDATKRLRAELERLGLGKVDLLVQRDLVDEDGKPVLGSYANGLIEVALTSPDNEMLTLHHEIIHHLRAARVLSGVEWAKLETAARQNKRLMAWAKRTAPELDESGQVEEAVAEMFSEWQRDKNIAAPVNGLFAKIKRFFQGLRRALRGAGFETAEQVFQAIESGKVGAREKSPLLMQNGRGRRNRPVDGSIIDQLPHDLQKPAHFITDTFKNALSKGTAWAAFTEDLVDRGIKHIPALKRFVDINNRRVVEKSRLEDDHVDVMSQFQRLPAHLQGKGDGTVNGLIQTSTSEDKWAFQPSWLTTKVDVDPALARQFNAMPAEAQDVVRSVFEVGHKMLQRRKAAAMESVTGTYDALIKSETDAAKVKQLERERKAALVEYSKIFDLNESLPYAPLRRYGDYIVVGKSQALLDAIAAGDMTKVNKMKAEAEHYFVDRYETYAEAAAMARELDATGRYVKPLAHEADKVADELVGGREMMLAFQRLREYIKQQGVDAPDATVNELSKLAANLYITALKNTSARKSELKRIGVASGDLDMMRNFVTQGRADAHFIAGMESNEELLDTISTMRREAGASSNAEAMRVYNEVMLRYVDGMAYRPSRLADQIKAVGTTWMLSLNPSYYLQNLTQPSMSAAYMAGEHGYGRTWGKMIGAYREIAAAWKGSKILNPLNLDALSDDVRLAVQELADRGGIDIGRETEFGEFHSLSDNIASRTLSKFSTMLRAASRKTESINRVATAVAAYRLAVERGKSHAAAVDYAYKVNRVTHGTYDGFNAPRWTRGPVLSTLTQFKKFQLMQLSLLARMMHNSFDADLTPVERAAARKAFGFTLAQTAVLTGLLGMPGASALEWLINMFLGDENEPGDIENSIREAIGDEAVSDLILKGTPTLGHIDVSNRIGMGQTFSVIPFVEPELNREGYEKALTAMAGPILGGLGPKWFDAMGMIKDGDYYRGLAGLLPNGVANAINAVRESTSGVTKRNGDVLLTPDEVEFGTSFARSIGLQTTGTAARYREQERETMLNDFYKQRSKEMNRAYIEARESGDTEALTQLRKDWENLQAAREENGFKRQPFTTLIKAAKAKRTREEKQTIRGVQYRSQERADYMRDQLEDEDPE